MVYFEGRRSFRAKPRALCALPRLPAFTERWVVPGPLSTDAPRVDQLFSEVNSLQLRVGFTFLLRRSSMAEKEAAQDAIIDAGCTWVNVLRVPEHRLAQGGRSDTKRVSMARSMAAAYASRYRSSVLRRVLSWGLSSSCGEDMAQA